MVLLYLTYIIILKFQAYICEHISLSNSSRLVLATLSAPLLF